MAFNFVSNSEFDQLVSDRKKEENVVLWMEFPQKELHVITSIERKESVKYGQCFIINCEDGKEQKRRVWGPTLLIYEVFEKKLPFQNVFFKAIGQEVIKKKTYNRYEVHFQEDQNAIAELFDKYPDKKE